MTAACTSAVVAKPFGAGGAPSKGVTREETSSFCLSSAGGVSDADEAAGAGEGV